MDKLLVCCFLQELLTNDMKDFLTEKDYRLIEDAYSCLYGSSCLLPYPHSANAGQLFYNNIDSNILGVRITEESGLRSTEDETIRFKASNYNG